MWPPVPFLGSLKWKQGMSVKGLALVYLEVDLGMPLSPPSFSFLASNCSSVLMFPKTLFGKNVVVVLSCSPIWLGSPYVDQAGFKFEAILLLSRRGSSWLPCLTWFLIFKLFLRNSSSVTEDLQTHLTGILTELQLGEGWEWFSFMMLFLLLRSPNLVQPYMPFLTLRWGLM